MDENSLGNKLIDNQKLAKALSESGSDVKIDVMSLGGKLIDNQRIAKAIAEGGGGGGGDYTAELRAITFVNNTPNVLTFYYTELSNDNLIKYNYKQVASGASSTMQIVGNMTGEDQFFKQVMPIRSKNRIKVSTETTYGSVVGGGEQVVGVNTYYWYALDIANKSPRDVTIAFETE